MTDPDRIHAQLDARPDDSAARHLLAELLAERGDSLAVGMRFMGERAKWPSDFTRASSCLAWTWWYPHPQKNREEHDELQSRPWLALKNSTYLMFGTASDIKGFPSRRAAEEALCRALARE